MAATHYDNVAKTMMPTDQAKTYTVDVSHIVFTALAAERERCARICEQEANSYEENSCFEQAAAAPALAEKIREGR